MANDPQIKIAPILDRRVVDLSKLPPAPGPGDVSIDPADEGQHPNLPDDELRTEVAEFSQRVVLELQRLAKERAAGGTTPGTGGTGVDGAGFEVVFIKTSGPDDPPTRPPFPADDSHRQTANYVPAGWSDDPPARTRAEAIWAMTRTIDKGADEWSQFSRIILWSGPIGIPGEDGEDGSGVEYVFAVTSARIESLNPELWPDNDWAFDRPGTRNISL